MSAAATSGGSGITTGLATGVTVPATSKYEASVYIDHRYSAAGSSSTVAATSCVNGSPGRSE